MCVGRITGRRDRKLPVSEERLMALASLCAAQGKGGGRCFTRKRTRRWVEHLEKEDCSTAYVTYESFPGTPLQPRCLVRTPENYRIAGAPLAETHERTMSNLSTFQYE